MIGIPYLLAAIAFIVVAAWYMANQMPEGLGLAGGLLVLALFTLTFIVLGAVRPGKPSDVGLKAWVAGAITMGVMVPMGVRAYRTLRRR